MLGNLRDQHRVGFGYTDKDGLKCLVADVHLRLIGKSYNTELNIRGHVWAAKYVKSKDPAKVWLCLVPREAQDSIRMFEDAIDKQTGLDSGFRLRKTEMKLWKQFIDHSERTMYETGVKTFAICENIGLQISLVEDWHDRSSERWVYGNDLILDHRGKLIKSNIDVLFYPWLSKRKNAPKTLPTNIKFTVGGKEFFQRVLGVFVPGNFFPYLLSLSAAMGLVHGQALRRLATCGQCPSVRRQMNSNSIY